MIEKSTGARRIWEPFHVSSRSTPRGSNFDFGWRPYLSSDTHHDRLRAWLAEMFRGGNDSPGTGAGLKAYGRIGLVACTAWAPATVVKFGRLQRLLPWLSRRFELSIVLLIRHPLAVVASQIHHPAWKQETSEHPVLCSRLRRDYPELSAFAEELDRFEERLAATWAFDCLVPLSDWQSLNGVKIITYADLVDSPGTVLGNMLAFLNLPARRVERSTSLDEPSATTREDSDVQTGNDPLTTWKNRLDDAEIDRVVRVVDRFGLNPYDQNLRPRWSRLLADYEVAGC